MITIAVQWTYIHTWELCRPVLGRNWNDDANISPQQTHGVTITSVLRQNDVAISFWRNNDFIITRCVRGPISVAPSIPETSWNWKCMYQYSSKLNLRHLECSKILSNWNKSEPEITSWQVNDCRKCHPGDHYWNYYPGTVYLSQATTKTHLESVEIRHPIFNWVVETVRLMTA